MSGSEGGFASARATEEQEQRFNAAVKPPLVGRPTPLAEFAREGSFSEALTASLDALSRAPDHLRLLSIRGDGHCLFRVFAAALVLGASWGGREAREALSAHLSSPLIHSAASEVARLVRELVDAEGDSLSALNDEAEDGKPALLVAALRRCAVEYMRSHAERFRHCGEAAADGCSGETKEGDEAGNWQRYCDASKQSTRSPSPHTPAPLARIAVSTRHAARPMAHVSRCSDR